MYWNVTLSQLVYHTYRISLIKLHDYYFFRCSFGAATIRGQRLFRSDLPIVWLLFEGGVYFAQTFRLCGYYSRAAFISLRPSDCVATIQGWRLLEELR